MNTIGQLQCITEASFGVDKLKCL